MSEFMDLLGRLQDLSTCQRQRAEHLKAKGDIRASVECALDAEALDDAVKRLQIVDRWLQCRIALYHATMNLPGESPLFTSHDPTVTP
jgi:hypothetical protein